MLERHDRARFEVFAYSLSADDDSAIRRRIVQACEHFIDESRSAPDEICARIRADGIDVLIDLNGHTRGEAHSLLARRPASVNVNYLGFPGTLGAYADYIIGDRFVIPRGTENEFSESVVRLPGRYQANDSRREVGKTTERGQHDLPVDAIVACSFNQVWKLSPEIWAVWMRAMCEYPRLVL